jgi:hypothetical protein
MDSEDAPRWLFRGVPRSSPEVDDVRAIGEVRPQRPDRTGEIWQDYHVAGITTETAYTSWTSERSVAVDAASDMCEEQSLSGEIVIFRVPFREVADRCIPGRDDESEYLIEGTVEGVEISGDEMEDEE